VGRWLWGFSRAEGLDRKTGVRDQGTGVRKSKGVLPGVKTPDSIEGLNAQAKAWAYLRNNGKDKTRG
jgi:hypothetical protein